MSAQLALPLAWRAGDGAADYLVTAANRDAVAWLGAAADWPVPAGLLLGPRGSGKSHLARLWAAATGGAVADDAAAHDPETLFHRWNAATRERPLLLTATTPPPAWPGMLPDLASRLAATPRATLGAPDDPLLRGVLLKLLGDRGLSVAPPVVDYLTARIERSLAAAAAAVDALDRAALAGKRAITIPLARDLFGADSLW